MLTSDFHLIGSPGQPVFRQDTADYALFYTPGCVGVAALPQADGFMTSVSGRELRQRAAASAVEIRRRQLEPFSPECLTLYLNNECNLACVYCYTDPDHKPAPRLDPAVVTAAAQLVAENCRRKGIPFTVVFHGGGEPTLQRDIVDDLLALLHSIATSVGVSLFRYVATNGAMPAEKASWLAQRFDLIGLSCDGPADIQDGQRPFYGGGPTSAAVERTADVLHRAQRPFHARVTVTGDGLRRQEEIVDYVCRRLAPQEIHLEPVYAGGKSQSGFRPDLADVFVNGFFASRAVARQYGIPLLNSASRPASLHGPYCNVFRHVVNLVPPGLATACFKTTDSAQVELGGMKIGALNPASGQYEFDQRRIHILRQQMSAMPAGCAACFNQYHCVRDCPDSCHVVIDGFRCRVQKALAYRLLREKADELWASVAAQERIYGTAAL